MREYGKQKLLANLCRRIAAFFGALQLAFLKLQPPEKWRVAVN